MKKMFLLLVVIAVMACAVPAFAEGTLADMSLFKDYVGLSFAEAKALAPMWEVDSEDGDLYLIDRDEETGLEADVCFDENWIVDGVMLAMPVSYNGICTLEDTEDVIDLAGTLIGFFGLNDEDMEEEPEFFFTSDGSFLFDFSEISVLIFTDICPDELMIVQAYRSE